MIIVLLIIVGLLAFYAFSLRKEIKAKLKEVDGYLDVIKNINSEVSLKKVEVSRLLEKVKKLENSNKELVDALSTYQQKQSNIKTPQKRRGRPKKSTPKNS